MSYTKGPWRVEVETTNYCDGPKIEVMGIYSIENKRIVETDGGCYPPKLEDAQLIAAAPDLLEAVKLALDAFEKNHCIDWNVLSDAIAKAEGTKE